MIIPKEIKGYMETLIKVGFKAYIIGGACRDYFIGIKPKDYDICTNATGEEILKLFPSGKVIGNEERQAKILTVVVDGTEISQFRKNGERTEVGDDLYTHLSTCDFTMDAIACDIDGNFIDPFNGKRDIENRIIRAVGSPRKRVNEDKLRVQRAIRFHVKYGFEIEPKLSKVIGLTRLEGISVDRIRDELKQILVHRTGLDALDMYGFLTELIPEYRDIKDLAGGDHHYETVDWHSIDAYMRATELTDNPLLCLADFLHDFGKAKAKQTIEGKGITFYNHENIGEEIARNILTRLKFSQKEISYVTFLVKWHMFGYMEDITDKAYLRFFEELRKAEIPVEDYVTLIYCDHQANKKKPRIKFLDFLKGNPIYVKYIEFLNKKTPFGIKDLNITGNDIINAGIKQGPEVGNILKRLLDEVQEGKIANIKGELIRRIK